MKTDALSRRLRFAPPSPRVGRLLVQDNDLALFAAIGRHGPLPTHYLYELTNRSRTYLHFQHRLTELYNGDKDGAYLSRPHQQHAGYEARYQHLVYDLTLRAWQALGRKPIGRRDPFLHQLMQACVGASLELGSTKRGLAYLSRDEILGRAGAHAQLAIPLHRLDRDYLIPDDLFAIQGLDERGVWFRRFAVEVDRNTESIERKNLDQSSFGRKVDGYLQLLTERTYREYWGFSGGVSVLIVTTNVGHAANLLDYIRRRVDGPLADRFALAVASDFGPNWRVPKGVLGGLVTTPWTTVNGVKDIGRP